MTPRNFTSGKAAKESCHNSDYIRTAGVTLHTIKPLLKFNKGGQNNVQLF